MKLPENYQSLTFILLNHLQNEPLPQNNEALRSQLSHQIKGEEFGELIAYSLKNNLLYINYLNGQSNYVLTSKAVAFIQKGKLDSVSHI